MTTTTPISETACVKSSALLGDKVSGYWNTRAEGYSLRTADELSGPRGAHWRERLITNLRGMRARDEHKAAELSEMRSDIKHIRGQVDKNDVLMADVREARR